MSTQYFMIERLYFMIEKLKRYSHIWILSYAFIYLPWFSYLEKTVTRDYYVIHTALDDLIPFSEYFIVPYLLWFVYVAGTILFFFFKKTPLGEHFHYKKHLLSLMHLFVHRHDLKSGDLHDLSERNGSADRC